MYDCDGRLQKLATCISGNQLHTMICGLQKAGVQVFKKVFKYYLNTRTVFEYLNSI